MSPLLVRFREPINYLRLSRSQEVNLPCWSNTVVSISPRLGVSYFNSCTFTQQSIIPCAFKQQLCDCVSLWIPWTVSALEPTLASGCPIASAICIVMENKVLPFCTLGPKLNSDFRTCQQLQAGVAWGNALNRYITSAILSDSLMTCIHCWMTLIA